MNLTATRTGIRNPFHTLNRVNVRPTLVYNIIIILALVAFEAFNYSTTTYALRDLLGDQRFAGLQWATLMAMAFCGLDFAGIASLITQKVKMDNRKESWYLFSAWLIAAAFNATLTWWGVSIAISNHSLASSLVANTQSLTTIVPVLVAIMVWVIRILIIGALTSALDRNRPTDSARSTSVKDRSLPTASGLPVSTQPVASHSRPLPINQPVRSIAARPGQRTLYNAVPTRHQGQNEFMASENRTRDL